MSAFTQRAVLSALSVAVLSLLSVVVLSLLSVVVLSLLSVAMLAGCTRMAAPLSSHPFSASTGDQTNSPGVTANSGGDTRGTILYQPSPSAVPHNPYALVSDRFVVSQRQKMAWALAEIDHHASLQAARAYPVPAPSAPGYTKQKSLAQAERQAQFNAYLLEKYHARFCNQFHVSYDQIALLIKEGREKNWPMPPAFAP